MMDKVFKALSDPTRRGVLRLLRKEGDMSAGEVSEHFPITRSTLSAHLNLLKEANLVVDERHGTTIIYSLNVGAYEEMVEGVMELFGVGEKGGTVEERTEEKSEKDLEKELLEAIRREGRITATGVALATTLSVEEADRMLSGLAARGHLRVFGKGGGLLYSFWEHDERASEEPT